MLQRVWGSRREEQLLKTYFAISADTAGTLGGVKGIHIYKTLQIKRKKKEALCPVILLFLELGLWIALTGCMTLSLGNGEVQYFTVFFSPIFQ